MEGTMLNIRAKCGLIQEHGAHTYDNTWCAGNKDIVVASDIPGPGRFEGNDSYEICEALDGLCAKSFFNEQFGTTEEGIWEALFLHTTIRDGKARAYIVTEDSNGFFSYKEYSSDEEARSKYLADLAAYESAYANGENL